MYEIANKIKISTKYNCKLNKLQNKTGCKSHDNNPIFQIYLTCQNLFIVLQHDNYPCSSKVYPEICTPVYSDYSEIQNSL